MTTMTPLPAPDPTPGPADRADSLDEVRPTVQGTVPLPQRREAPARLTGVATALATAAVAWAISGFFDGTQALVATLGIGLLTSLVGTLIAGGRHSGAGHLLAGLLPLAVLVIYAANSAPGAWTGQLRDALLTGQIGHPPLVFDAGWQLLAGGLVVASAAGAIALASALDSARAAVVLPGAVVLALTLVMPATMVLTGALPAVALLLLALALANSAEESRIADGDPAASWRTVSRPLAMLAVVAAVVFGLVRLGLLPDTAATDAAVPPGPPTTVSLPTDTGLFSVRAPAPVPLRLGILDDYRDGSWRSPGYRPAAARTVGDGPLGKESSRTVQVATVFVTVEEPALGAFLPTVAGAFSVAGLDASTTVSGDSGAFRLPVAAQRGLSYSLRVTTTPADALAKAPLATAEQTLAAPPAVKKLLDSAPDADPWARIELLRRRLFDHPDVSGSNTPVPVSAKRAAQILRGAEATPFEMAATDALLVRWAGVESRVAFGFFDTKPGLDGRYRISSADATSWVEVHTRDGRWVPLTMAPEEPGEQPATEITQVLPNGQHIGIWWLPEQVPQPWFVFTSVRYWLAVYAIAAVVLASLWLAVPTLLRARRRRQRRRWAAERGPAAQIAVEYAEWRDTAIDLRIGHPTDTPLEFLDAVIPDPTHVQFAWLVDRALWGDLSRDCDESDVEAARRLRQQLSRRLRQGQPYLARTVALGSHLSLREPWSTDLPHPYPPLAGLGRWRARDGLARLNRWQRYGALAVAVASLVLLPVLVGADRPDLRTDHHGNRAPAVPSSVAGTTYVRSDQTAAALADPQSLLNDAALYEVKDGKATVGVLQTARFKPGLESRNLDLRTQLVATMAMSAVSRIGPEIVYSRDLGTQRQFLWFSQDGQSYQVLTTASVVAAPEVIFGQLLAAQAGRNIPKAEDLTAQTPPDVREWP